MTITFENDNDVIAYALEKIICYARDNRYIFVAQSVWWIASIIGLSEGLATHIDNLRIRFEASQLGSEADQLSSRNGLKTSLLEGLNNITQRSYIHPDRTVQFSKDSEVSEAESSQAQSDRASIIIQSTNRFIGQSRKERKAFKQKPCVLSQTRSGKIRIKPLTKKQRNRLQVVLATVPGYPAAVRVWNRTGWTSPGCYPENRGTCRVRGRVRTGPRFHFTVPTTLAPIKFLSSDRIMT